MSPIDSRRPENVSLSRPSWSESTVWYSDAINHTYGALVSFNETFFIKSNYYINTEGARSVLRLPEQTEMSRF